MGHLVIERDQVGQVGPAFHEPVLAGSDPLDVLHMPGEHTQGESLHNLAQHWGQTVRPVVPRSSKKLDTFFLNLLKALKLLYLPISKGDGAAEMFPEITRISFQLLEPFGSYLSQVPQSRHATMSRRKQKLCQSLSRVSNSKLWEGYKKVPCGQCRDQCYCSSV